MLKNSPFYAGFAVDDVAKARAFFADTLGVDVVDVGPGLLALRAGNGYAVLIYVDRLREAGVEFERYDQSPIETNEKGIANPGSGPRIAWFKDPAGNILSVLES